jgi:hypothetical protein
VDAQPDDAKRDDANDTEHDHDTSLLPGPVLTLRELHGDVARVEGVGVDGRHLCGIDDEARCGRRISAVGC